MNGEQPGEKLSDEAMPGEELFGKDAQNLRPRLTTGYPLDTLIQKLQWTHAPYTRGIYM